ncbi:RagB/SusD family nutrient uptake outer membrane protein [Flavobacterium hibernum]|uniref:RagB/SusD family nutrient uptake outer membrane protein n=1 Tax=Flavobacterium hibernum TaxID=37752 RepID=A0A0D0EFT7_9FLAO|nr:RagB/SusD family nutrient uptake outer membrane protein [Flavobacterium hibernum]KIO54674.1 starch-binding protein [Flavobacterium hibernum]OXA84744.1 RagB/SusD family nutrient uptake outer membrane protein [Flavobacterium hibernum]STO18422.1 SusD family [Flavobacterium hibernum]
MRLLNKQLSILIVFLAFYACDSFVETNLPKSQLSSSSVFENYETANAALMNIYAKLRDTGILTGTGNGLSNALGNYTDELTAYGTPTSTNMAFYNNALLPGSTVISSLWNASYNQIYAANALIEGLDKNTWLTSDNKKQLLGEALFLRAVVHFYLTNLFGDVPYITATDYKQNSTATKIGRKVIYGSIIADLETASALLPVSYSSNARGRANKLVCRALLSRVYLYNKSYAEAANEASALINSTNLYGLESDLNNVFLINSKETIWQFESASAGQNTKEGSIFIFTAGPPASVAVNTVLASSFAAGDQRKSKWLKAITKGTDIWYHPYKYKEQSNTSASKEYSVVLRLAEQYLIRAEARAAQGDLIGAKEDLNKIRLRSGLQNTQAASKEQLLAAVQSERRWELFTEYGHRFFDLKRLDQLDAALSSVKAGWNTEDSLFPIPQSELGNNPKLLPQNPGY